MIDKHPVTAVGHVKRNIFIGQLAGGAAILVPDIHHLAVLDKCGEAFAQPVHVFANRQRQLFVCIMMPPFSAIPMPCFSLEVIRERSPGNRPASRRRAKRLQIIFRW